MADASYLRDLEFKRKALEYLSEEVKACNIDGGVRASLSAFHWEAGCLISAMPDNVRSGIVESNSPDAMRRYPGWWQLSTGEEEIVSRLEDEFLGACSGLLSDQPTRLIVLLPYFYAGSEVFKPEWNEFAGFVVPLNGEFQGSRYEGWFFNRRERTLDAARVRELFQRSTRPSPPGLGVVMCDETIRRLSSRGSFADQRVRNEIQDSIQGVVVECSAAEFKLVWLTPEVVTAKGGIIGRVVQEVNAAFGTDHIRLSLY